MPHNGSYSNYKVEVKTLVTQLFSAISTAEVTPFTTASGPILKQVFGEAAKVVLKKLRTSKYLLNQFF